MGKSIYRLLKVFKRHIPSENTRGPFNSTRQPVQDFPIPKSCGGSLQVECITYDPRHKQRGQFLGEDDMMFEKLCGNQGAAASPRFNIYINRLGNKCGFLG
mmetsp:Transcript_38854/g.62564  ORF Transcript_38854/g.62564 Transcript_38854/m.62564 type:complete len:101 (+) Transcript_38854:793-1095(+)